MSSEASFAGSIPALYDRHLAPLLFEPYADEVARRAAELRPRRILETAAGTGIVTAALAAALPCTEIVSTDLNQSMLDVAAGRVQSNRVSLQQADALDLPFGKAEFDLVVCQFGMMFFPDKILGHSEALRVLREGGRYLAVVWDRIERNPASLIVHETVARLFPRNPPAFLLRTPFGYADPDGIVEDLRSAGFGTVEVETVELRSRRQATPRDAAIGLVYGCPLRGEIEERDPNRLEEAARAAEGSLQQLVRNGRFDSRLSAHMVLATR